MAQQSAQSSQVDLSQISSQLIKQILQTRIRIEFNHTSLNNCLYAHKQILNIINFVFDFKFQASKITSKIYEFIDDPKAIDNDPSPTVLFFIYAKPQSMNTIASIVFHNQSSFIKKQYYIFFVPTVDFLCEQELKRIGVWQKVKVKKFDFNFIPFTDKLLSLQLPAHLTSIEVQNCVVEGLLKLQFMRGAFKNIVGKGKSSKSVLEYLQKKRKSITEIEQKQQDNDILIVLDRATDLITPMLTGLSYECLLDFFFSIDMNRINVPGNILGSNSKIETFLLNNKKDPAYEQISSININEIAEYLREKSQKLKQQIKQQKQLANDYESLNKLNSTLMVEYLLIQNHQSLVLYILQQMKTIQFSNSLVLESSILQGDNAENPFTFQDLQYLSLFYPLEHLLRMACLCSNVSNQSKFYTKNEKQLLQFLLNIERIDQIPSLYNLVKGKILQDSKYNVNWKQVSDKLELFPQQDQADCYTDINIIYSSLSIKCIQLIIKNKLDPQKSALIHKQSYFHGLIPKSNNIKNIYILIIGGISYNQISCLKRLSIHINKNIKILTTEILSHNQIIKKFLFDPFQT